jgi:hypothetical protein
MTSKLDSSHSQQQKKTLQFCSNILMTFIHRCLCVLFKSSWLSNIKCQIILTFRAIQWYFCFNMFAIELMLCFSEVTNVSHHHKLKKQRKVQKSLFSDDPNEELFFWSPFHDIFLQRQLY